MIRVMVLVGLLVICAPVVLVFWMDHSTPFPSEIALMEKLTPDVATTTEGEEQYLSDDFRKEKSVGIWVIESIKPATNQFFRRIDWKGKQYWLNAEQYKPHAEARLYDIIFLVLNALGCLLLFAIAYIQYKEYFPEKASNVMAIIVAAAFMTALKPGWWFLHPLWMTSVIILWICIPLYAIAFIKILMRNIHQEIAERRTAVHPQNLEKGVYAHEFATGLARSDQASKKWIDESKQERRKLKKDRRHRALIKQKNALRRKR